MHKQDIAFNIIPAALAKLTEARNTEALQVLADNSGMDLTTFMSSFGHHAIAKFLYEGAKSSSMPWEKACHSFPYQSST